MDYSNHKALFQPLVGTESIITSSIPVAPSTEDDVKKSSSQTQPTSSQSQQQPNHDIWITVLLFTFMYLHFGMIYYSNDNHSHIINGVSWMTINISISLFIIATFLYRQALHDCCHNNNTANDTMILLPEILIILSMTFVFFHNIMAAFLILAVGKLYMAFTVILINAYQLWSISSSSSGVTTEDDDETDEMEIDESKDIINNIV